jgi:phosphoketolase
MTSDERQGGARSEAARLRRAGPAFARWAEGAGAIKHTDLTQVRIHRLHERVRKEGLTGDGIPFFDLLVALDRLCNAGMWLVAHATYARRVYLDGRALRADDFKPVPEGHMGGSLNMVPAYCGYLAANAITGHTRAWLMGQGHCVSAVDAVNVLVDNMTPAHAARYDLSDDGLTRFVRDFYGYRLGPDGRQESPLGSHVNPHTAGGIMEGGYLGFAELQYVHMPLPGERLVAFLSDGAFEEQRGSDWAPRWWRAEDCGLVAPIMIKNGRRIDQRTTLSQQGGTGWFERYLRLQGFDPVVIDGRDPAAFLWAICEQEWRLEAAGQAVLAGKARYPVALPYGIAVAPKGYGFYGAGTNLAHNLPLKANPHTDRQAAQRFNRSAAVLHVPPDDLRQTVATFQRHAAHRPQERDHALVRRDVRLREAPHPVYRPVPDRDKRSWANRTAWTTASPMSAVDEGFTLTVQANPQLRPRVGNPDEMKSNRMLRTLELLKFRVTDPEPTIPESITGAVITALNEEAVVSAALANKGGINITVTYEAFGMKMHGVLRQEIIFTTHCLDAGRLQAWLSIPLILTSHTWENAKNEQSHQDPSLAEALFGEVSHVSRVLFPADTNTAAAVIHGVYRTQGQFWTVVVPKADTIPDLFSGEEAERLLADGALHLDWASYQPERAMIILTAIGAYQLGEVLRASARLVERGVPHRVNYLLEPGRFRIPRHAREQGCLAPPAVRDELFPAEVAPRVFVGHTRPEPLLGVLAPLHTGRLTRGLGFLNHGGTYNTPGLLFVNRSSWAHCLAEVCGLLGLPRERLLTDEEIAALEGRTTLHGVVIPPVSDSG